MDVNISFVRQTSIINTFAACHKKKIFKAQYDKAACLKRYTLVIANPQENYLDNWYLILFDYQLEPQSQLKESYRKKILSSLPKHGCTILRIDEHFYVHCERVAEELKRIEDYILIEVEADSKKRAKARKTAAHIRAKLSS